MTHTFLDKYNERYGEKFVADHAKDDTSRLRLSLAPKCNDEEDRALLDFALLQIEARRKYAAKLKDIFAGNPHFLFPSMIAGEQASHWLVAKYHTDVVKSLPGYPFQYLIDITAGLGIDFMSIVSMTDIPARGCTAIELDPLKAAVLLQNMDNSGWRKAKVVNTDSMEWLSLDENWIRAEHADANGIRTERTDAKNRVPTLTLIFADPARRSESNARLYDPEDCLPDIVSNFSLLSDKADSIMIKYSPMLDVAKVLLTFPAVRRIHIVCVKNECKEVLVEIVKDSEFEGLRVVNLSEDSESIFEIPADEWRYSEGVRFSGCGELERELEEYKKVYLYEPNAGIMKSGAWGFLLKTYPDLKKADLNTHLFISPERYDDFPGRMTEIESIITKKDRKSLKGEKINVVCRNFPVTPEKVATELKLKPSPVADRFLYAFTIAGKPVQVLTRKVSQN